MQIYFRCGILKHARKFRVQYPFSGWNRRHEYCDSEFIIYFGNKSLGITICKISLLRQSVIIVLVRMNMDVKWDICTQQTSKSFEYVKLKIAIMSLS
jgi:hypothetical protein